MVKKVRRVKKERKSDQPNKRKAGSFGPAFLPEFPYIVPEKFSAEK